MRDVAIRHQQAIASDFCHVIGKRRLVDGDTLADRRAFADCDARISAFVFQILRARAETREGKNDAARAERCVAVNVDV